MARQWGGTRAYVRELDQVPTGSNFSYGGVQYLTNVVPNSARWERKLSQIGSGVARFYPTQNWDKFLVPGRVLVVEQPVSGYSGFLVRTITCFLIEDVEPNSSGEIDVRGPGAESLLARKPVWTPIGEERVYPTTIAPQNQTPAVTSLAAGVPPGNQSAVLVTAAGCDVGDTLRIRRGDTNDGDWFVATVTNKAGNTINFSPAMTGQAAQGNDVQSWPASGGQGAHAPITATLVAGAPHGMDAVIMDTTEGMVVGDEIRVRTGEGDAGPWFSARIRSVNPSGAPYPNTVQFVPDLTADAPQGNSVEVRAAQLRVYDPRGFAEGQRIGVNQNSGTRETVVTAMSGDELTVTIRDGLTTAASIGNAVTAYDYGARTTADVTQALANAPEWGVAFESGNGSAEGTAFTPKGESIADILISIAERTGEFWRYSLSASGLPTKQIQWRRTPDSSGVTLVMYGTTAAEYTRQRTHEVDATKGAVFSIQEKTSFPLLTRIYPSTGDQQVTLAACSTPALLYAAVEGCTVHISDDFYEPDYVEYAAGVADPKIGVHAIRQTYGDISLDDANNSDQLQAACDQLLFSAVRELLQAQLRRYYTVEAYVPVALKPGQTVKIENATRAVPNVSDSDDYVVLEVSEYQVDGRPRTRLIVSNMLGLRRTGANTLGSILRSTTHSLRRVGAAGRSTASISVTGSVVGSHVHAEYLPVAGGVTLAGNMPVANNVTIDGVDISAHAANPAAHHAPVTVANLGLNLAGQAVGLRLSAVNPGLSIRSAVGQEGLGLLLQSPSGLEATASGLAIADALAGDGLRAASKTLHLDLAATSGLLITGGLQLALAVANNDLSAASVSELRPGGHGHRIVNSWDGQTNPATLLASGPAGQVRLAGLAVGTTWPGSEGLLVQPATATQTAARFKAAAAQTAPLWRVENSAGQALLLLTGDGNLESGNPAFVSGLTGWQIESRGKAEFNDVFVRGELHATTFVADEMHATGGTLAVMTATTVAAPVAASDNKMGQLGAAFVLNLAASWDTGMGYVAPGDVLRVKTMSRVGAALDIYDVWLTVDSVGALTGRDLANGEPGWCPTTVTRRSGGSNAVQIPTRSAVVRWGKTGQIAGTFTGGVVLTADLNQAPFIDIFTVPADAAPSAWSNPTGAATAPTPRVRLGNLDGVLGLAEQWGIAAGTNLSSSSAAARYIVASDQQLRLNNVDLSVYRAAAEVIRLNSGADGTSPYIGVGSPMPTGPTAGGAGVWMGLSGSDYQFRVGHPAGSRLAWDGAALKLYSAANAPVIALELTGASYFAGPMTVGVGGGIWQGTGTFANPTTGLKLYNSGGIGRLASYNGGAIQTAMDTDGAFKAGWDGAAWNVLLNAAGLGMVAGGINTDDAVITSTPKRISWNYGGTAVGWVAGRYNTATGAGGIEMVAGPNVAGAGAKFNYRSGAPQTSSLWATGDLRLASGAGYAVQVVGDGLEVQNGHAVIDGYLRTADSLYAANGVVVGGSPFAANANAPGVLTLYRRTTHAGNPAANSVALYVYHNTATGKHEFIMRNAAGATVKVAELAAA